MSRLRSIRIHECVAAGESVPRHCRCKGWVYGDDAAEKMVADGLARWHERTGVRWHSTLMLCQSPHTCPEKPSAYSEGTGIKPTEPQHSNGVVPVVDNSNRVADEILGPEYDMARGYLPTRSPRQRIEQARPVRARDGHKDFTDDFLLSASVSDGVKYRDVQVKLFCLGCYQAKREPTSTVTLRVPADVDASWKQFWTCRHCCGVGVNPEFKKWYDTHNYVFGMTGRKQQLAYPDNETCSSEDFADELRHEAELRNDFEGILQDKFIRSLMTAGGDTDANDTRS
jgi:hypothetical protein